MRDRVARLRRWLAGGVFLLLAVLAAFIGYGRYVSHLRHLKLPLPPGVNIVRQAGGWTYSRADGSKTLYTIHAGKFEQGKNGKTTLHGVSVVLYGKKDDRRDRVYGDDFEYDEKAGVLRALGKVHIDLEGAAASRAVGQDAQPTPENVMHVTTSGLVYLEKLGIAATSEDVDVQSGGLSGHARGADYSSDSGLLMLHSAVSVSGTTGGRAVRITAEQAQFDQRTQEARLVNATYSSEGRSMSTDEAVLHRRPDGTLERVNAEGHVTLATGDGKAVGHRAELQMNAMGKPATALLAGDVVYTANQPQRQVRSEADAARVTFAANRTMQLNHAVFTGAVHIAERTRALEGAPDRWNSRDLRGAKVEVWMAAGPRGEMRIRNAQATGNAKLVMVDLADVSKGKATRNASTRTEVAADELKATMSVGGREVSLKEVTGEGHTSLLQLGGDGVEQTSQGDLLQAKFRAADAGAGEPRAGADTLRATGTLVSAVQQGHVSMIRRVPGRPGSTTKAALDELQRAVADRASYDGIKDQLLLSGAVRMSDASGAMWAQEVTLDRATGDAHASGPVKVDYAQSSGGEPMHILAEHADVKKANSSAVFFGSPVRVWQDGNQVQAPEVEIDRAAKRLVAHGDRTQGGTGGANGVAVRTILVSAAGEQSRGQQVGSDPARCGTAGAAQVSKGETKISSPGAVRIGSASLVYSGSLGQVDFSGGVRADTADASVRAMQATAYLVRDGGGKGASVSLEGGLDRMVASGQVELTRAGSHASGERLVYEVANRSFLLSGGTREPARIADARGTSKAAAFRFSACDNTLQALGEAPGATLQRVETDAQAGGAGKREKAGR